MPTQHPKLTQFTTGRAVGRAAQSVRVSRLITVVAAAALTAGLAACGNSTAPVAAGTTASSTSAAASPSAGQSSSSSTADAPAQTSDTGTADAADDSSSTSAGDAEPAVEIPFGDGQTVKGPPGFSFPQGAKSDTITFDDTSGTIILTAPSAEDVVAYYRTALPKAGYTIEIDMDDLLLYRGKGWVGNIAGEMITYGLDDGSTPSATEPASNPDQESNPQTFRDVGLTHAPFFMRYPAKARVSDVKDTESATTYALKGVSGADALAFYRDYLPRGHFTIVSDVTADDTTTITFTETDGYTSVLTVVGDDIRFDHSR